MVASYRENAISLGVPFNDDHLRGNGFASTDFGNVSQVVPSIHPVFKIVTESFNHNAGFTESALSEENQPPTLKSAKSMAMTAIDVVFKEDLLAQIKEEFAAAKK